MMAQDFWWLDFGEAGFRDIDPEKTIAVLPLAATEQHGPHLPPSTDSDIMDGMLAEVRRQLPSDLDIRVRPVERVGLSTEHVRFPKTQTASAEALLARWVNIGEDIARTGIRKLVMVNSHGGNEALMSLAALTLRERHNMLVVKTSWERFGAPEGLFDDAERKVGIHGGDYETSLMLHFFPDRVNMKAARNFESATTRARREFKHLAPQSPHGFAWLAGDLNPEGVTGNAAAATAEKGRRAAEHQVAGFLELLQDVRAARLDEWLKP